VGISKDVLTIDIAFECRIFAGIDKVSLKTYDVFTATGVVASTICFFFQNWWLQS